jgi:hypothetical protein
MRVRYLPQWHLDHVFQQVGCLCVLYTIPSGGTVFCSCECCLLSGRGLCQGDH